MGHTHGIVWTDELIKQEIKNVMNALCIDRMPTRKEIINITKSYALPGKISKTKGYYGWAKELNLPIKNSETTIGKKYEYFIKQLLEEKGFEVEKMSQNYPYDLLVNKNIRIDVKAGNPYIKKDDGSRYHTFNLYKKYATCDIYIIICLDEQENIEKLLVIPANKLKITQLSLGKESIYDKYKDNFKLLDIYNKFYSEAI